MEKGELKTGQLLGIVEKRGKLIREYVAGFFGDEPIIKQRLLTPQEARRYREDKERGISEGKTSSEASQAAAGRVRPGAGLAGKPGLKRRPAKPGTKLKTRPAAARGDAPVEANDEAPVRERPTRSEAPAESSIPQSGYGNQQTSENDAFIQQLIDSEQDKPNFNPANRQKALTTINRIGSPEMKIFQIGTLKNEKEGYHYSQKEYLVRIIMGLPLWKPKAEVPAPVEEEKKEEAPAEDAVAVVEPAQEAELVTAEDDAATDAKFDA
ncbi:MAG: hypothetical protein MJE63_01680 [Proteobacteria bacterium]|nr:hypothetical protein [Pseudomonadota bacterium]